MTHKFINDFLEENGQCPVLLEDCVLNITDTRSVLYILSGDYKQVELEICYADNHSDVIWNGVIKTKQRLKKVVLENLK